MKRAAHASSAVVLMLIGCAHGDGVPEVEPPHRTPPSAEISELEIRGAGGVDRFATCPPPGELGQQWIPPIPSWTPPPREKDAESVPVDQDFISRMQGRSATELAVEATHRDFQRCYRKSTLFGPRREGRVAVVLRIGSDGRVAKTESYAACAIPAEAVSCMKGAAARLRFPPPSSGSETVVIPAAFASRSGLASTVGSENDSYTAQAYVALETARPALHACEERARTALVPLQATGTFVMNIAPDGHVSDTHVDPWTGERSILMCAAKALDGVKFAPPPGGRGTVVARLNFNPRQATR